MTISKRNIFGLLLAVALIQTGILGFIVYERLQLLATGREILVPVIPVDPRDIFRGDYVRLGYPISSFDFPAVSVPAGLRHDGPVYVTIKPDAASPWKVVSLSTGYPLNADEGSAILKGRISNLYDDRAAGVYHVTVRYGIESYFVAEGTGKPLEEQVRDHKIETVIALAPDGTAAIKGLVIDGVRHLDPPLF